MAEERTFILSIPPEAAPKAGRLMQEMLQAGVEIHEVKQDRHEEPLEPSGAPFRDDTGTLHDSQAAWYVTRHDLTGRESEHGGQYRMGEAVRTRRQQDNIISEIMMRGVEDAALASPGFLTKASIATLEDGSRIMIAWPQENNGACQLYQFAGKPPKRGQNCWIDWGCEPPVASGRMPSLRDIIQRMPSKKAE